MQATPIYTVFAILLLGLGVACGDPEAARPRVAEDAGAVGDTPEEDVATVEDTGDVDVSADVVDAAEDDDVPTDLEHLPEGGINDFANGCVTVASSLSDGGERRWLRATADGQGYGFEATSAEGGSRFFMKASDLGTYLLYDEGRGYLVAEEGPLLRQATLESDLTRVDDSYVSGAEWQLELSERASLRYQLRSRRMGRLLGEGGLVDRRSQAVAVVLEPATGCTPHPEMSLDATGVVEPRTWDDGALFGAVDAHSHILANFGFGGGGIYHGAPFHRLGVEHAMGDCEHFHGPEGRADFLGWGSSDGGDGLDSGALATLLSTGLLAEANHATDGWPTFSDWPSYHSSTHQTQYFRWLQRAWMAGLRLIVQHAVSNEALCDIMADTGFQPVRYGCEDKVNIDRQLLEIRQLERYIDAQAGGPGEGWFRVVGTPEEAREVIGAEKLAVILGIEVPNPFECYLTRRPDGPVCDDAHIRAELDRTYALGVRAVFPVHKYDNAFSPGDGDKGIFELGSFLQSGHWSNYVQECPDVDTVFDKGPVQFGGFNEPRDDYLAPAPNPLIQLSSAPLLDLLPFLGRLQEPSLPGNWCQNAGLTAAGVTLVQEMMGRGMIIELDHLPRRSYLDAFELVAAAGYPAAGTHGNTNEERLYDLGGISTTGFARCADAANPGSMAGGFRARRDQIVAAGGYPAEGFGFDLNGLAGVPRPRFGPDSSCSTPQADPVTWPFASFAGDVRFQQPSMGDRMVDFNTEGMIHIGLFPELIEDARRTGVTDEDLEIVFRSAEAYLRMWERARSRASQ